MGNWNDPNNWNPVGVPVFGDFLNIPVDGVVTIQSATTAETSSITINGYMLIEGSLEVANNPLGGNAINLYGTLINQGSLTIADFNFPIQGFGINIGFIGRLENYGQLDISNVYWAFIENNNVLINGPSGTITASTNSEISGSPGIENRDTLINEGFISVKRTGFGPGIKSSDYLNNSGIIVLDSLGGRGIDCTFSGFENSGIITISNTQIYPGSGGDGIFILGNASSINSGTITIESDIRGNALYLQLIGATFTNTAAGVLNLGDATFDGIHHQSGTFENIGTINVCFAGGLGIENSFGATFNNAGTINLESRLGNSGNGTTFHNTGSIIVPNLTCYGFVSIVNGGEAFFTNDGTISTLNSGGIQNVSDGQFMNHNYISTTGLLNSAMFTNSQSGLIEVDSFGLRNNATFGGVNSADFTNLGTIAIQNGFNGIWNSQDAQFDNQNEITISNVDGYGVYNDAFGSTYNATIFANSGTLVMADIGTRGINNFGDGQQFANSGDISISNTGQEGIYNSYGASSLFSNTGIIQIGPSIGTSGTGYSAIYNSAPFENTGSGSIEISSAGLHGIEQWNNTITNTGLLVINTDITQNGIKLRTGNSFDNLPGADLQINDTGSDAVFLDGGTFTNGGKTTFGTNVATNAIFGPDGTFTNQSGGELWGVGNIDGLVFTNNGYFRPGFSPGYFSVTGDYDHSTAIFDLEIAGNAGAAVPGGHDQLQVLTGSGTIGGTLNIMLIDGFTPSIGDSYVIVTCDGGCNGIFDNVTYPIDPVQWGITYDPNEIILTFLGVPLAIEAGPDTTICSGQSVTLAASASGGTGNYAYLWDNGLGSGETQVVSPASNTTYTVTISDGFSSIQSTVTVLVDPSPEAVIAGDLEYCQGASTTLDGGTADAYAWSTNESTQSISVSVPDVYTLTVTAANGCTDETEVTVNELPAPVPEISGDPGFCAGQSTTLDAGVFNAYAWSNAATAQTINVGIAGEYTVTVTDANNCSGTDEVTIVENPLPTPGIAGDLSVCQGESTQLDAGPFSAFTWSTNESTQTITVSAAGEYSVTVTDENGCASNTSVTVTQNAPPQPVISGETDICAGEATLLDVGLFAGYAWSTGGATQTVSVDAAGTYTVTVTDGNGCTGIGEITVSQIASPQPMIAGDFEICAGETALLDAGIFSAYAWSTGESSQVINPGAAGIYSVTVTDANGCSGTQSEEVTVNQLPSPDIAGDPGFCAGESTELDAGPFDSFAWSTGQTGQVISTGTEGLYTVTVTDVNGCTGTDAIAVSELALPEPSIFGETAICPGDETELNAGNFVGYNWSTGETTQVILVADLGVYTVSVTDASGCVGTDEVTITQLAEPEPDILGDLAICPGGSTLLDAGVYDQYAWSNGTFSQTILATLAGLYTVTVTDANGCSGQQTVEVVENPFPEPLIEGSTAICAGASSLLEVADAFEAYAWSTGETGQSISIQAAGAYAVTVTDENGCTGTDEVFVDGILVEPDIIGQLSICFGNTTTLIADGFESYLWSTNETSNEIVVGSEGFYTLTVTDVNGCTGTDEVFVSQTDALEPDITGDAFLCSGSNALLDAGTFSGYLWSTGETSQQILASSPGIYTVTVTDVSGCSGTDEIVIAEVIAPVPEITGDLQACSNEILELSAGPFEAYQWSDGTEGQSIVVSTPGVYSVTVTDQNGCTGTDEVVTEIFQAPEPEIDGDNGFCAGESVLLTLDPFDQYSWSNGSTNDTVEIDQPGIYTVTVTDANGCTGTDEMIIDAFPDVDATIIGSLSFCTGNSTVLNVGPAPSIEWSTGSESSSILVTTPGTYAVTVSNNFGCSETDTVEVIENDALIPGITGGAHICFGDTITLSAGSYDQYAWSNGDTTGTIQLTTGGLYTITVSDAAGCTGEESLVVTESSALNPQITGPESFCSGEVVQLAAGTFDSYLWSTGSEDQTILVIEGGTYMLTVADAFGCTASAETSLVENEPPAPVISGSTSFCTGGNTMLSAGNFASYLWSNGGTTGEISVSEAGTYSVTVTDANGCTGTGERTVTEEEELMPAILGELEFCFGDSTQLSAGNFDSWLWSDGSTGDAITVHEPGTYSVTVTDAGGCSGENTVVVVETEEVVVEVLGVNTFCSGDSVLLDAGPFDEFQWSTGADSGQIEVNTGGAYSVTVTDGNGCKGEGSIEVLEFDQPLPEISGATSICTGNSTVLDVGEFISYQWSTGEVGQQIEVSESGLYSVTVTDGNGCAGQDSAEIIVSDGLMPEISGILNVCTGGSSVLSTGLFDGYQWSTGASTQEIEVTQGGIYTVTVTDQTGCTGEAAVEVAEVQGPIPEIHGELKICSGSATMLEAGSFSSYIWSTGDQTPVITVAETGLYRVTVTDENGCTGEASAEVTVGEELTPVISGTLGICEGSSTVLDAGNFSTYAWSTGGTGQQIEVTDAGVYAVTVTDGSGCTGESSVEVTVGAELTPVISGTLGICEGSSTVLDAGNFSTYAWSTGGTGRQIEVTAPGVYGVTVSDVNGCTGFTSVEVEQGEQLFPEIAGPSLFCPGESVMLATGNYVMYQWSTGSTSSGITVDSPGEYTVTVTDENGCSGESSILIDVFDPPVIDAGEDVIIRTKGSVTLKATGGLSYIWSGAPELMTCVQCTETVVTPNETTTFYVTGTDANGCEATDSVTVFVVIDLELDPVNTITPNGDGRNDVFFVRGLEPFENAKLTVFNRWGDVLYSSSSYQNDWKGTYNGKPIPAGTYLYLLRVQVFDQVYELKGTVQVIRE